MRHPEDATVREWTDLLARVRFGVVRIDKRNTIAGSAVKAVAARLADYADSDGSRIHPGLARVALDVELSYDTAKRAIGVLVRLGLLRVVHTASRRGDASVYQLAIPTDLLDGEDIDVWSPARQALEIERLREAKRGGRRDAAPSPHPRSAQRPVDVDQDATRAERSAPRAPVDNSHPQSTQRSVADSRAPQPTERPALANPDPRSAQRSSHGALSAPPPTNDLYTTTTDQEMADVRTAVTGSRATGPSQDQISPEDRAGGAAATTRQVCIANLRATLPSSRRHPDRVALLGAVYATPPLDVGPTAPA